VTDVAYIPAESVTRERQPAIGYAMALGAGTLFAINGTVSKVILESGLSSLRLRSPRTSSYVGTGCSGLRLRCYDVDALAVIVVGRRQRRFGAEIRHEKDCITK